MGGRQTDRELTVGDYLGVLRRRLPWLLLPLAVLPALAALRSLNADPVYEATASVLVVDTAAQRALYGSDQATSVAVRALDNSIERALGDEAERLVADRLGVGSDELDELIVRAEANADVIHFTARSDEAEQAARFANTWADAFVELERREAATSVTTAVDRVEDRRAVAMANRAQAVDVGESTQLFDAQIAAATASVVELRLAEQLTLDGTARLINAAALPNSPSNASLMRDLALALVVGAVGGTALALLVDNLDRTIDTVDDLRPLGVPVLAAIPRPAHDESSDPAFATIGHPASAVADGYERTRISLAFALLGHHDCRTLLVTSAQPAEGKTSTATNLAAAFANAGSDTVLLDADLRRPRISQLFAPYGTAQSIGLTGAVLDDRPIADAAVLIQRDPSGGLVVVPSGEKPPDPARFLGSSRFARLLNQLRDEADVIVIDAPPTLPVADAVAMVPLVDAIVLVVQSGKSTTDDVRASIEQIESAGGTIVGAVLVGAPTNRPYYESEDEVDRPAPDDRVIDLREAPSPPADVPASERVRAPSTFA